MIEETPGEALYGLAQDFQKAGDRGGWQRTLEYLIRRYPSSRFAVTAKQDLANAGLAVPGEEPAPEDAKAAQAP